MAELLSEVEYGRILGSFTAVAEDFGDTVAPDAIPLTGTVTFYPSQSHVSYINLAGETASLYIPPTSASIVNGRIIGSDGKDGVVLLASNSNNVSASVLWTARIRINPINSGDPAPADHDFLIEVRRGEIASLIDVIKATSRVHNIALFHDAIAEAAAAFWERVESGEFRGNQGPPGPAGVGVGVPGPVGRPGIMGKDGDPGVGGNLIPDGDLEEPGFLVSGDYQESSDAVSGNKAVRFSNATSRRIRLEPDTSYVGTVYLKSAEATTVNISQRVFGSEGDIDRVIEDSYQLPADTWQRVTFLLDSNVGDQSMEIVVTTNGRTISADLFALSDSSVVKGLQRDLTAAKAQLEAAMAQLDLELAEVDADKEMLAVSLNDLAVVLEDADVDLTELNAEMEDLKNDLIAEETKRQDADAAAQVILEQLDTNLAEAKQELVDNKIILETLDTDLATAKEELLASAQSITKLETETLPELQRVLEEANTAAIQELAALDDKLYGAAGDITAAKASIAQLAADLTTEAQTRAQLALDLQDDFEERDTRLSEAESILSAAFPDGAVNVPEELSRTIRDSVVQYAVSNSAETPPTTGWSSAAPNKDPGQYIWFRTLITYGDNSTSPSSAALLTGNTGPGGPQGPAGEDGTDGTGVTILGSRVSEAQLPTTGNDGDAYLVGGYLYVWSSGSWSNVGLIRGPQGVPGPAGEDGEPRFTWVKYASSASGAEISDDPAGKSYIGLAYNKPTAVESDIPGDYQWALIQGPQGSPGIQGPAGEDGTSLYTWLKYASTPTTGMSDSPIGKDYIGLAYNKTTPTESDTYTDYQWTLIKGAKGDQGVPGDPGADGTPRYTWVKYATSGAGAGMSDDPTGKTYIGLAYNKTTATESTVASDYQWALIQGPRGEAGPQGVPGPEGADGESLYTWIKYATTPTTGMADLPAGKKYMGIAYNKTTATESSSYSDYEWSLIEGPQGNQGIQGPKGTDGQTTYTWIKYGTSSTGAGMADTPAGKTYIGIAYNKTTATESSTPGDYQWSLIQGPQGVQGSQGIPGPKGLDGPSLFTWIKYADTPTTGMNDLPAGKKYMGIAYNKTTATESSSYSDYEWSLIEGPQGNQGIQGPTGADGQTTYTWIKYGTSATGAGISDSPTGKTYIGIAYNKTTATESGTASDYEWSLIQGPQGATGGTGPQGIGISNITPYYRDVVRGAAAPAVPTTATPSGWATSEPTWVPNRDLYRVEKITYTNSTFAYTAVTKIAAYAGIDAAMAAANGKNLNTYSDLAVASKPGPAPANNSARTVGDVHRNRNSSTGEIWAEYQWTGSAWKPVSFGDSVLTSLDVGKITGGTGAFQQFFADKLIADDATINTLWTDKLVSRVINTSSVVVAAGDLNAPISSGAWTIGNGEFIPNPHGPSTEWAAKFNKINVWSELSHTALIPVTPGDDFVITAQVTSSATSGVIGARLYRYRADGTVATLFGKTYGLPITNQKITFEATGSGVWAGGIGSDIVAVRLAFVAEQGPVNGELILSDVHLRRKVGAVLIENGAVSADKINAESVAGAVGSFIKLTAGQLTAGTAAVDSAVINKLWADGLSAKSITATRLAIAPGNLFPDPYFQDKDGWGTLTATNVVEGSTPQNNAFKINTVAAQTGVYIGGQSNYITPLEPGATYRVRAEIKFTGGGGTRVGIYARGATTIGGIYTGAATFTRKSEDTWEIYEEILTIPETTTGTFSIGIFTISPYTAGGIIELRKVEITRRVGSVLIENGAVNASKINAESVGAAVGEFVKLDVKNLTSSTANIDSLVAQKIAAGTAAFQTVNADKIIASTGTMDSATINQIWADGIAAKTITTSKMTVAPANLIPDPHGHDPEITAHRLNASPGWTLLSNAEWRKASDVTGNNALGMEAPDRLYETSLLEPGQRYVLSYEVYLDAGSAQCRWAIRYTMRDGSISYVGDAIEDGGDQAHYTPASGGTWTTITRYWDAPSDATTASFDVQINSVHSDASDIRFRNASVRPMVGAVLIENGAISANHMTANSIDTEHLRADAVSAEKIVAGAITTEKMTANSINGDRISANSLQANKIAANTITATQIKARAISAAEIATRTLLAENIVASTITANEIKARTITAAEIFAGTITANEIKARTITAEKIVAGAITANELDVGNITANTGFIDNLWTNGISTKTINAATVHVGTADNLLPGTNTWSLGRLGGDLSPWSSFGINTGDPSVWLRGPSNGNVSYPVRFRKGVRYRFEVDVRASVTGTKFFWEIMTSTETNTRAVSFSNPSGQASTAYPFNSVTVVGTSWNSFWAEGVANEDADGYIRFYGNHSTGAANASGYQWFRNPRIQVMTGSTIIEEGAIQTKHITADSISGDRIQAGTLSAEKIKGGSFSGETFEGGVFKGAEFQAPANPRWNGGIAIDPTNGLRAWSSSGTQTVSIDPAKGDLRMGAGVYLTGSDRNGLVLNPPSGIGTASIYFTRGESMGIDAAAIWRLGYTTGRSPLMLRGANGAGITVNGDESVFNENVSVNGNLGIVGVTTQIGHLKFPSPPSTSMQANVYMNPTNGVIARSSSSRRYKRNIEDWEIDAEAVLRLQPRRWQAVTPMEGETEDDWFVGMVAEEVEEVGLPELVSYDGEGRADGLHYPNVGVAHQAVLRKHEDEIKSLTSLVAQLREDLDRLNPET